MLSLLLIMLVLMSLWLFSLLSAIFFLIISNSRWPPDVLSELFFLVCGRVANEMITVFLFFAAAFQKHFALAGRCWHYCYSFYSASINYDDKWARDVDLSLKRNQSTKKPGNISYDQSDIINTYNCFSLSLSLFLSLFFYFSAWREMQKDYFLQPK